MIKPHVGGVSCASLLPRGKFYKANQAQRLGPRNLTAPSTAGREPGKVTPVRDHVATRSLRTQINNYAT